MVNLDKQMQLAQQVYEKWLSKQDIHNSRFASDVENFFSKHLYSELLNLRNESMLDIGAYIKVYLHHAELERTKIAEWLY